MPTDLSQFEVKPSSDLSQFEVKPATQPFTPSTESTATDDSLLGSAWNVIKTASGNAANAAMNAVKGVGEGAVEGMQDTIQGLDKFVSSVIGTPKSDPP
jgi:hypothetical protein